MKRVLLLALLLSPGVLADDTAVARVQSIKPADGSGKAVLTQRHNDEAKGFPVSVNCPGYLKDHFSTDQNTLAALEFLIGGRVGINKGTEIEIVNEKSVADANVEVKRVILKNGSLWVKADARQLKQPLEIQTNGGTLGIKGTEFTVECDEDDVIQVSCFESSSDQGGVEIHDFEGKVVGVARPGDQYRLHRRRKAELRQFKDHREFRERVLGGARFKDLHRNPYFAKRFLGGLGEYPSRELAAAYYAAHHHRRVVKNPRKGPRRLKVDFPTQLEATSTRHPHFRWDGVARCNGYVVMLARDQGFEDIVFTERVGQPRLQYSSEMRPLKPGNYFWRVIPVDANDQPVQQAAEAEMQVAR